MSGLEGRLRQTGGRLRACLLTLAACLPLSGPAWAVESDIEADPIAAIAARQAESQAEYQRILDEMTLSDDRMSAIAADIATLRKDSTTITAALIQAAKTEKKLAEDVAAIGQRLGELREHEAIIKTSLDGRRAVLAEVLGALQRMGLNPPPAILVKPEDALSSVRSAILLGAVVPELRQETESLLADLREQTRVTASIEAERARLSDTAEQQVAEKRRLAMLLEEKERLQAASQEQLAAEQRKAEELAASASSLQDLIAGLERETAEARAAAEAEAKAQAERVAREEAEANKPVPEANRLVAAIPFDSLKGQVALPVAGRRLHRFGQDDDSGGVRQGDTLTTQSGAIVTAPAAGTVLYAGPFRSYGQLLILNAGDDYHIVLAGMGRISVALGQTVLAGEPVGAMGEMRVAGSGSSSGGNAAPDLYVEFRKNGKPVDPAAWWSERIARRTANDS